METKEMKIVVPEGYEIDKENSTFECIKFKPKNLTYRDVEKILFKKGHYWITRGNILYSDFSTGIGNFSSTISEKQLEKLLAINKLMNVAKYLNGDWKPNWNDNSNKWFIYIKDGKINICHTISVCSDTAYFKLGSLAQQAVDILGEDTIRLALSTDW